MQEFINLTTHPITEVISGKVFEPSGSIARAKQSTIKSHEHNGCPIYKTKFEGIDGLPEPREGVVYIVSALAMNAIPTRPDVVSPGNLQRDSNGKPIGCVGFRAQ